MHASRFLLVLAFAAATTACDTTDLLYGTGGSAPVLPPEPVGTPAAWTVEVGTGETGYAPLGDGDLVAKQRGPQGGYHVWVALRVGGKLPSGVDVELTVTSNGAIVSRAISESSPAPEPAPSTFSTIFGLRAFVEADTTGALVIVAKVIDPGNKAYAVGSRTVVVK